MKSTHLEDVHLVLFNFTINKDVKPFYSITKYFGFINYISYILNYISYILNLNNLGCNFL